VRARTQATPTSTIRCGAGHISFIHFLTGLQIVLNIIVKVVAAVIVLNAVAFCIRGAVCATVPVSDRLDAVAVLVSIADAVLTAAILLFDFVEDDVTSRLSPPSADPGATTTAAIGGTCIRRR